MRAETAHLVRNIGKADPTGPRTTRSSGPSKDVSPDRRHSTACRHVRARRDGRPHAYRRPRKADQQRQAEHSPAEDQPDYSDAENINTLFDRIENAFVRLARTPGKEESTPTKRRPLAHRVEKVRPDGGPATVEKMLPGGKLLTDAPKITYNDEGRQEADGVIARTLTNGQATAIDPFTWPKDGGFFIRIKHVVRPESNNETRYNLAAGIQAPADRAVYDMAQEGKSAAEILEFIGKASRRPFNRYLANALKTRGIVNDHASTARAVAIRQYPGTEVRGRLQLAHRYGGAFHCPRGGAASSCMSWCTRPR